MVRPEITAGALPKRMIRRSGNRFADKIMRHFNKLARDRTQNRYPLLLIARYGQTPGLTTTEEDP
jgi:hypothetical protein